MKKTTFFPVGIQAFFLLAVFWCLYHTTRSWLFSYDSLTNALEIEIIGFSDMRSPAHMLPTLLGILFYKGFVFLGHPLRALYIVQQLNVLWGAVTVAVFYAILVPRFGQRQAGIASAALGFSYAFWSEVVDPGVYPLVGLGAVGAVGLILYRNDIPPWVAGALSGCLLLAHQMFIFVLPCLVCCQWSIKINRPRRLAHFFAGLFGAGIVPYGFFMVRHSQSGTEMIHWLLSPPGQRPQDTILHHQFWNWTLWQNLPILWHSTVEGIIGPPLGAWPVAYHLWFRLWELLVLISFIALFYKAAKRMPLELSPVEIVAMTMWIVFTNLFQLVFAVGIVRYKIIFLPAALTLLLGGLGKKIECYFWPAAGWIALLGIMNFSRVFPPARAASVNPDLGRIAWVARRVTPGDFFLFSGDGKQSIMNVALRYFAPQVNARSLRGLLFEQYGRADYTVLEKQMKRAWSRGGHVFVETCLLTDKNLQELLGGRDKSLGHWLQNFSSGETFTAPDLYRITQIVPRSVRAHVPA